ncbi:MAG: hypothetical protein AB8I08_15400 [Sandaracinaceae bacterium]
MRVLAALVLLVACGEPPPPATPPATLDRVTVPTPVTIGSIVEVAGTFDAAAAAEGTSLQVLAAGQRFTFPLHDTVPLRFLATASFVEGVGDGEVSVVAQLVGDVESDPFDATWRVARSLPLSLDDVPRGAVHYNEALVLRGEGFHGLTEGTLELCAEGTFEDETGRTQPAARCVPAVPIEAGDRSRANAAFSSAWGSRQGAPGTFRGDVWVASRRGDEIRETIRTATEFSIGPPVLFGLGSPTASVETRVRLDGAGFMDPGDGTSEASSAIRITGVFTDGAGQATDVDTEIVPAFESGSRLRWRLVAEPRDGRLGAAFFAASEGVFEGVFTPELVSSSDTVVGQSTPVTLTLAPVRQAVLLRFLPQFGERLAAFGLSAAFEGLRTVIAERVRQIFAGYRVDVHLEAPIEVSGEGLTVIDIGGPDPAGQGLFGRDSSPGKDVGNLRLFDQIGGANAEVQEDGFPGFGGVFVDSYLWWSSHPELPGERPPLAPAIDPLFDAVFDPVRARPVTFIETRGVGEPERLAEVDRALRGFAFVVGETAAHELGHALGLADPFGAEDSFHNATSDEGCLMDPGPDRPFGERAGEPGFAETRFCGDAPVYLRAILGE